MNKAQKKTVKSAVEYAISLGDMPANVLTPTTLALKAEHLHEDLEVTILDEEDMKELGMGLLLGVSQGSDEEAKLIVVEHQWWWR